MLNGETFSGHSGTPAILASDLIRQIDSCGFIRLATQQRRKTKQKTEDFMLTALKGKTALVTGGARGIGRAIVERLAANGAAVVVNYARNGRRAQGHGPFRY